MHDARYRMQDRGYKDRMQDFKILIFFTVVLLFLSCSDGKESAQTGRSQAGLYKIELSPSYATKNSAITAKVLGIDTSSLSYQWIINDKVIEDATGNAFKYPALKKNDRVQARVLIKNGEELMSEPLIISNITPQIQSANFIPPVPKIGDELRVEVKAFDGDGDNVFLSYEWSINGQPASGRYNVMNIDKNLVKRDDKISVKITPTDGEREGQAITLYSVIVNSPPNVSATMQPKVDGSTYTSQVIADDPEADPLTYSLVKGPAGMKIDPQTGVITWQLKPEDKGRHDMLVSVNDGHGGEVIVPISTRIDFAPQ